MRQQQDSNFASEEESLADNCSVVSNLSELRLESDDDACKYVTFQELAISLHIIILMKYFVNLIKLFMSLKSCMNEYRNFAFVL